jgi:hypothetical protein
MLITRESMFTGIVRTLDIPVTETQIEAWEKGEYPQRAFSNLTPDQIEFIMTGITGEEWDETFGRPEE